MISYQRHGLQYVELYFDEPETKVKADVVRYVQRPCPVPNAESIPFSTRVIDLDSASEDILAGMSSSVRYAIRRCAQDNFRYSTSSRPSQEALESFCGLQDQFSEWKNLPRVDRLYHRLLSEAGMLQLSSVVGDDGAPLAWKSYIVCRGRARILQGGSARFDTNANNGLTSRANIWSAWQDLLHFQRAGFVCFDFGGWYTGDTDPELLRINDFKRRFGGRILEEYKCLRALSARGKLALAGRNLIHRWRNYRSSQLRASKAQIGYTCG